MFSNTMDSTEDRSAYPIKNTATKWRIRFSCCLNNKWENSRSARILNNDSRRKWKAEYLNF